MTINLGRHVDDILDFSPDVVAWRKAGRAAARVEAVAWRTRPGMPPMRDPDDHWDYGEFPPADGPVNRDGETQGEEYGR